MIAVDTNILVYAHRRDSIWHGLAKALISNLVDSGERWAIPSQCLHEFVGVSTHPRVYSPPSTIHEAFAQIAAWRESVTLQILSETLRHWTTLEVMCRAGKIAGPAVHDARIAAICEQHGVKELWSADRDFSRFPKLRVRNPLI